MQRLAICVALLGALSSAQDDPSDLTKMSLEELSKVTVTSVSRKDQKLNDTAAAIYVISQADIRNSPATSLPELLRMVPGLDVAQIAGGRWAVSSRGFAEQYADKMLVLVDGRSIFDPLFSGVVWSDQDFMLEDIDHIEVIRGPGATMWGPNAVNGVINIITKSTKETQGLLVTAGRGDQERSHASARYGGRIGQATTYRVYAKYYDDGPSGTILGVPSIDSARSTSGGLRVDSTLSRRDALLLEGQAFGSATGIDNVRLSYSAPYSFPVDDFMDSSGESGLARWTHRSETGVETQMQLSGAHLLHRQGGVDVNGNKVDASLQQERPWGTRHDFVAGVDYQFRGVQTSSWVPVAWWQPASPSFYVTSGFVQDEVLFLNGDLRFTGGIRVEYNQFSGVDFQPTTRLLWKVRSNQSVWAAYSHANRSPSLTDFATRFNVAIFPGPLGVQVLRYIANPKIGPETVNAFELGYHAQPAKKVAIDVATFYNRYSDLLSNEAGQPFFETGPPPRLVVPLVPQNNSGGGSYGGELALKWNPRQDLNFGAAYSLIELGLTQPSPAGGTMPSPWNGQTPRHQLDLRSSVGLSRGLTFNSDLFFVDRRTSLNVSGYAEVDSALAWRPAHGFELTCGAHDLFNKEHVEFYSAEGGLSTTLGRSVFGRITWRHE